MKNLRTVLAAMALIGLGMGLGISIQRVKADASTPTMVYELRTYFTEDGRLPALNARFRDHTVKLFEKHGINAIVCQLN